MLLSRKKTDGKNAVMKGGRKLLMLLNAALHDDQITESSGFDLRTTAQPRQGHQSSGRFN